VLHCISGAFGLVYQRGTGTEIWFKSLDLTSRSQLPAQICHQQQWREFVTKCSKSQQQQQQQQQRDAISSTNSRMLNTLVQIRQLPTASIGDWLVWVVKEKGCRQ